jgi:hypothetical protein
MESQLDAHDTSPQPSVSSEYRCILYKKNRYLLAVSDALLYAEHFAHHLCSKHFIW